MMLFDRSIRLDLPAANNLEWVKWCSPQKYCIICVLILGPGISLYVSENMIKKRVIQKEGHTGLSEWAQTVITYSLVKETHGKDTGEEEVIALWRERLEQNSHKIRNFWSYEK